MFWIHGGGFMGGSGSFGFYDGAHLASRNDVVVVTKDDDKIAIDGNIGGSFPTTYALGDTFTVTNEENYVIMKFARAAVGTNNVDHCARL